MEDSAAHLFTETVCRPDSCVALLRNQPTPLHQKKDCSKLANDVCMCCHCLFHFSRKLRDRVKLVSALQLEEQFKQKALETVFAFCS